MMERAIGEERWRLNMRIKLRKKYIKVKLEGIFL